MSIGNFPKCWSQGISVWMILVGRLGVLMRSAKLQGLMEEVDGHGTIWTSRRIDVWKVVCESLTSIGSSSMIPVIDDSDGSCAICAFERGNPNLRFSVYDPSPFCAEVSWPVKSFTQWLPEILSSASLWSAPDTLSELHKYGNRTTGHSLFRKGFLCFNTMPRRPLPSSFALLAHF